jgi:hypothetical protein
MGVETALAVGGVTASTIGSVASFAQASKQNKLMKQAQADAEKAMNEARAKLDVNYYKQLAVQKEPYELEREALLSSGAQAIQAGVESERGAAATAGRIQMAQIEGQAGQRTAMGKELSDLAKLTVAEESRLRDEKAMLDLAEAQGQQLMARDAQRAKTAAITQGFAGLTSAIGQGAKLMSLYPKTTDTTTTPTTETNKSPFAAGFPAIYGPQEQAAINTPEAPKTFPGKGSSFLPSDIANMSQDELDSYLATLTPEQQEYYKNYFASQINPFGF